MKLGPTYSPYTVRAFTLAPRTFVRRDAAVRFARAAAEALGIEPRIDQPPRHAVRYQQKEHVHDRVE